jgi:hypothetical protein
MRVLGIRFCSVSSEARQLADFFGSGLGLPTTSLTEEPAAADRGGAFSGAVFPAGDHSWIEIWGEGPGMPAGTMLQIVVDDADALAAQAKANGLQPQGPTDAHGERIYFLQAPGGLAVSFQSRVRQP